MEYKPIPGKCAFRDLLAAPCPKSGAESSKTSEDSKGMDNCRMEEYKAQALRRSHQMV